MKTLHGEVNQKEQGVGVGGALSPVRTSMKPGSSRRPHLGSSCCLTRVPGALLDPMPGTAYQDSWRSPRNLLLLSLRPTLKEVDLLAPHIYHNNGSITNIPHLTSALRFRKVKSYCLLSVISYSYKHLQ